MNQTETDTWTVLRWLIISWNGSETHASDIEQYKRQGDKDCMFACRVVFALTRQVTQPDRRTDRTHVCPVFHENWEPQTCWTQTVALAWCGISATAFPTLEGKAWLGFVHICQHYLWSRSVANERNKVMLYLGEYPRTPSPLCSATMPSRSLCACMACNVNNWWCTVCGGLKRRMGGSGSGLNKSSSSS